MDTTAYIPNEKRLIITVRYNSKQVTHERMYGELDAKLAEIDAHLDKDLDDINPADGSMDWSFTTLDRADPVARIRIYGDPLTVESALPVEVIDEDLLIATTWLDGEMLREEQATPDTPTNRIGLADGHLTSRIKAIVNRQKITNGDWNDADRLQVLMATFCALCQQPYGDHYDERCPVGGQHFTRTEDVVGYGRDEQGEWLAVYWNKDWDDWGTLEADRHGVPFKGEEAKALYKAQFLQDMADDWTNPAEDRDLPHDQQGLPIVVTGTRPALGQLIIDNEWAERVLFGAGQPVRNIGIQNAGNEVANAFAGLAVAGDDPR